MFKMFACSSRIVKRSLLNECCRRSISLRAGQPIFETRPNLVKKGDITPGISAAEYFNRRYRIAEQMEPGSIAIVAGQRTKFATESVFYYFQQNNDLFYLTGWDEPDSVCILEKPKSDPTSAIFHMIVPPSNPEKELWEGERTGVEGVRDIFNADVSMPIGSLPSHLSNLMSRYKTVYYDFDETQKADEFSKVFPLMQAKDHRYRYSIENILRENNVVLHSLKSITAPMRAIKSDAELRMMRLAGKISGRAYNQAYARRFKSEKGLQAFLEYRFVSGGCNRDSYIPVVAGGENALCIHYTRNDNLFKGNEFVLLMLRDNLGVIVQIFQEHGLSAVNSPPHRETYMKLFSMSRESVSICVQKMQMSLLTTFITRVLLC